MNWRFVFLFLAILGVALSLTGCSDADPSPEVVQVATATTPPETATPPPTVILPTPTVTPTKGPPTPTATLVVPPATSTPLPPTATPRPEVYIIQEGDTLLTIAFTFETTVEALMAANGLDEEDFLQIGQELRLPAAPEVTTNTAGDQIVTTTEQTETPAEANEPAPETGASISANAAPPAEAETGAAAAPPPPTSSGPPLPTVTHAQNINPLTGLPVDDPAKLQRRPLLVRVGNDVGARQSQVGLNSADVVYEEITEWWVTRFTAIFLAETPPAVGPVRSARLINVQLAPQYQGALAHSGGSDPVRWEISQTFGMVNLDEYFNARPYFYRPNEGWQTRLAIDAQAARTYLVNQGSEAAVDIQGFLFADTIAGGQPGQNIYIPYPRATSFTEWHYDAGSGKYLRWINGAALDDVNSGQVAASNVIVYFAQHQQTDIVEDSNGATSIRIIVNGQGPAWFFRDGKLNKGAWQTDGRRTPYFSYEDGRPYTLKPGNTWVEVVPAYYTIGLNSADEANSSP